MVQGGYNVSLGPGDSVERHFMDTINGGKWLPDQDMAWRLCEQAVVRVRELENEVGCFFDREPGGQLHHKAFAGQTADRTVHKGDLTGIEIINRLMEQVLSRPIERLQEHRAVGLIPAKDGSGLSGVLFIDMRSGGYRFVRAKAVLMATGHAINIPTSVFDSVRALTATIAAELGETAVGSPHYQALFTIGISLFVITFIINLVADLVVRGVRES